MMLSLAPDSGAATGELRLMLVDRYVMYLRAAGRAESTVNARRRQALDLVAHVDPLLADTHDLLTFLARPGWKPATRAAARAGVRSFFGWLRLAGHREDDPSAILPPVRVPAGVPHPAGESALAQARARSNGPHERLMVELAARCGLRRKEIATLRFDDLQVQADGGYALRIVGKGGRTRVVPIPLDLAHMVLDLRVPWVFPSRFAGKHMSPNWVGERLSDLLGPTATAHDLRHRYATRIYGATHDLLAVQQLLGHSSPATTQVYVRVPMDDLRRAAATAS